MNDLTELRRVAEGGIEGPCKAVMSTYVTFGPETVLALIDELEQLRETLATVKAITDGTPECDKYDDKSPVTCGSKFDLQRIKEVMK